MTQAKIEPGKTDLSLDRKPERNKSKSDDKEHDWLPELGLKSPIKKKDQQGKPGPRERK